MIQSPGILIAAFALLVAALGWSVFFNIPTWATSMLVGAGAIVLGVWIGTVVTRDPGLIMRRKKKPPE